MVQIGDYLASWTDTVGKNVFKTTYIISYPATPNMQGIQEKSLKIKKKTPQRKAHPLILDYDTKPEERCLVCNSKQVISCQAENLETSLHTKNLVRL